MVFCIYSRNSLVLILDGKPSRITKQTPLYWHLLRSLVLTPLIISCHLSSPISKFPLSPKLLKSLVSLSFYTYKITLNTTWYFDVHQHSQMADEPTGSVPRQSQSAVLPDVVSPDGGTTQHVKWKARDPPASLPHLLPGLPWQTELHGAGGSVPGFEELVARPLV